MRAESFIDRYRTFASAAAVGAHANARAEGFRQRDLRFLIELFSNWVEHSFRFKALTIQNTQISRYLEDLVKEGFARKIKKQAQPLYRLSRIGLVQLISEMVNTSYYEHPEQFFFVHCFIDSYSERIFDLVKSEGAQFPPAMEMELKGLLDVKAMRERQITQAEAELHYIDRRISDSLNSSKLIIQMTRKGATEAEMVKKVEELYPYELNSKKPLSELMNDLPAHTLRWELEVAGVKRAQQVFIPSRAMMTEYIRVLREMGR